jgi:hypothetical protein
MARLRPNDPEGLAATVAALRAFAEDTPANEFEETAVGKMRASGANRDVARRLVARFDRTNPSMRRRALGEFADRPVEIDLDRQRLRVTEALRSVEARSGPTIGAGESTHSHGPGGAVLDDTTPDLDRTMSDGTATPTYTYGIKYLGLVCEKETTWDGFSNSDEVYAVTSAVTIDGQLNNVVRTEKHPVDGDAYEDVDADEVREGPEAQCWGGNLFPVSLTVVAFERDYGDPDEYRDEVDVLVKAAIVAAGVLLGLGAGTTAILEALSGTITDAVNWLLDTGDDRIDIPRTYVFSQADIEAAGGGNQHYYNYLDGTQLRQTNLIGHLFSTHSGSGARYTFGFRFERDPEFEYTGLIL